jgi:hypothetical protein
MRALSSLWGIFYMEKTSFSTAYGACSDKVYNMGYNITIHTEIYIFRGKNGYCAAARLYCQEWRI